MRKIANDYISKPDPKVWDKLTTEEQRFISRRKKTSKKKKVEKVEKETKEETS